MSLKYVHTNMLYYQQFIWVNRQIVETQSIDKGIDTTATSHLYLTYNTGHNVLLGVSSSDVVHTGFNNYCTCF